MVVLFLLQSSNCYTKLENLLQKAFICLCIPRWLDQFHKTQNVTKLKTQMWQNSKTQNVTKLTNSECDKTQKFKKRQNSKTLNVTNLKKSKFYKTEKSQNMTK